MCPALSPGVGANTPAVQSSHSHVKYLLQAILPASGPLLKLALISVL